MLRDLNECVIPDSVVSLGYIKEQAGYLHIPVDVPSKVFIALPSSLTEPLGGYLARPKMIRFAMLVIAWSRLDLA